MNSYHATGRACSATDLARRRWGGAKPAIIIGLVVLIGVLVPLGVYFVANIVFPNGTTGADLSVPDTGNTVHAPVAAKPNAPAANNKPAGRMMDLLVVDHETKQPISGIRVQSFGRGTQFSGNTGTDGRARVPIPSGQVTGSFSIRVSGRAYAPERLQWASYRPELEGEVPASYMIEMEHSTKVSGKIIDDNGQPVAGAFVYVDFTKKYSNSHEQIDLSPYNQTGQIRSGEDGSWVFNGAPLDCDEIGLTAWDYKHVTGDFWSPQPFSPVSKLYDGTAVFTLHRGLTVEGVVLDPQGSPAAGASVGIGQQRGSSNAIPAQNTDASGHFSYQFDPGQQVILTIQARGCAPEMRQFMMGQQNQSLTIQLSKPHRISGKIVNASGKPVRDAYVNLQNWRGFHTIDGNFRTDSGGNFHWNEAPVDSVTVNVNARGLRGVDHQVLVPDQENVIKLGSVSQVRGTVTDAQTGKPIENFRLVFGILWQPDQQVTWQRGWNPNAGTTAGGNFHFTDNFSYPGIAVRIEMPGYMPAESRIIKPDEGDVTLDFKMKPAKDIVLTIRAPDGKPVAGATAVMAIPGQQVNIFNGREVRYSLLPEQTSGPDGRVDFSPQAGEFTIAIFSDAGSAEVDQSAVAKSADVTLAPWGRIQGRMMIGSKAAAGQELNVFQSRNVQYDPAMPRVSYQFSATTDDDGRFVFDRVSPGGWTVSRRFNVTSNTWNNSTLQTVEVSAGQIVTANVGGMGRPVVGKVIIPPEIASRSDWSFVSCQITTHTDYVFPPVPMPDEIKKASREKQQQWIQDWMKTDSGKTIMETRQKAMASRRYYSFTVAADGSFRVEDVLAGTYDVSITLRSTSGQNGMGEAIGMGSARLVVPEMPGGRSDEPLQMDPIPIIKVGKYLPGDLVCDLPMISTDGKNLKLSQFRGKYVLLDFRQTRPAISQLKAVYNAFGRDKRLVMLTVTLNYGVLRAFKLPDVTWQQVAIEPNGVNLSILRSDFAVNNSPGAWLIGPDGKVVAEDLSGDAILSAVTAALGPPATQPATQP
ncbi:MAG: hypothetical protein ABSB74_11975 [Tepidisphaeraceae bacterium]